MRPGNAQLLGLGLGLVGMVAAFACAIAVMQARQAHRTHEAAEPPPMVLVCTTIGAIPVETYRSQPSAQWYEDRGAWVDDDLRQHVRQSQYESCHTEDVPRPPQPEPQG